MVILCLYPHNGRCLLLIVPGLSIYTFLEDDLHPSYLSLPAKSRFETLLKQLT